MASATRSPAPQPTITFCPGCGTKLPRQPQRRPPVQTFLFVVLLLGLGFAGGWLSLPPDSQVTAERQRLQQEQQQLADERQRLRQEQQQFAATQAAERSRVTEGAKPALPPSTQPAPSPPVTPEKATRTSLGVELVLIQPGEFTMGANDGSADNDEKPPHKVRISKPFYLGKYEVTQAQWQAIMGNNPSSSKGETLPVEQVSWNDVQEFVRRLNAREGGPKYRLPTEAEWEYAARAGTTTSYSFGENPGQLGEYAWFGENAGRTKHPVGQKKPNPWGLYDMHGNVWEWVQDWYGSYTAAAAVDPAGPASGTRRVNRGGSWNYGARDCRSALRGGDAPGSRLAALGFRLLREVP